MSEATTKKEEEKEIKKETKATKENGESKGFWVGFKKKLNGIFRKGGDSKKETR